MNDPSEGTAFDLSLSGCKSFRVVAPFGSNLSNSVEAAERKNQNVQVKKQNRSIDRYCTTFNVLIVMDQ